MVPEYMASQASFSKDFLKYPLDKNGIVKVRLNKTVSHTYYFVD